MLRASGHIRSNRRHRARFDALSQPLVNFGFQPSDRIGAKMHSAGKLARPFQAVDVRGSDGNPVARALVTYKVG